jgi:DNA repair protein RadA/Sms
MPVREKLRYVCQACGAVSPRWMGRCEACGAWNTLQEESALARPGGEEAGRVLTPEPLAAEAAPPPRLVSGIAEFDRVLGGGLVPGGVVLLGGDPGIGKSTLMLDVAARAALGGARAVYVSGEESLDQIRLRARRLGLGEAPLALLAATRTADIAASLAAAARQPGGLGLAVIDSIQTLWSARLEAAPGTLTQVRAAAFELIELARAHRFALVLIGHVTKDGVIAGPRVLEHMVDAVLYFEGDRGHQFRILRGVKNRFGATDEIGVFEMTAGGLAEVANPSALFLAERRGNVAGAAVYAGVEGSRPVLLEIQALLAPAFGGPPRRTVIGWDPMRLGLVLAVLEARGGVRIGDRDVYLNVTGGLRIEGPAADLAAAAALLSALSGRPTPADQVYFGEIGLSGEIRQVPQTEARLREAAKLGFTAALLPRRLRARRTGRAAPEGLTLREIGHITDLIAAFGLGRPVGGG